MRDCAGSRRRRRRAAAGCGGGATGCGGGSGSGRAACASMGTRRPPSEPARARPARRTAPAPARRGAAAASVISCGERHGLELGAHIDDGGGVGGERQRPLHHVLLEDVGEDLGDRLLVGARRAPSRISPTRLRRSLGSTGTSSPPPQSGTSAPVRSHAYEVYSLELGGGQAGRLHLAAHEQRAAQIGAVEIGAAQIAVDERGAAELRARQLRLACWPAGS